MVPPTPTPSTRLLKAAAAERQQLARHRDELVAARAGLRAELARIEASLEEVAQRETLLERLVGLPPGEAERVPEPAPAGADGPGEEVDGLTVLRGPDIRRAAVRVLLDDPRRPEAMHYRDWYGLLRRAGFAAGGKDPVATFLTQLSRSPAVRKSTRAGVYELDFDAGRRLRRRLVEAQDELRKLASTPPQGTEGAALRARRAELNRDLGRIEKALEEVEALFGGDASLASAA